MWLPPTPHELMAKCPFDGHSPYNDVAKAMLLDGRLLTPAQETWHHEDAVTFNVADNLWPDNDTDPWPSAVLSQ